MRSEWKKCPRCGEQIPGDASFCPMCMAELVERESAPPPREGRKRLGALLALLCGVAAALLLWLWLPRGETAPPPEEPDREEASAPLEEPEGRVYGDGGSELTYQDGETAYRLTAHFDYYVGSGPDPANNRKQWEFVAGEAWNTMFYLSVWDGKSYDPDLRDRFVELVESAVLTVEDVEGQSVLAVNSFGPCRAEDNPAYEASLGLLAQGEGRACWKLKMKNGDTIRLYGAVELSVRQLAEATLTAEEAPDLAALLERLEELCRETPERDLIQVTLPPVAYEGELRLTDRPLRLVGSADGERRTSLAGSLTVGIQDREPVRLAGIDLLGDGGTGLTATSAVILSDCLLTGYDKAVEWLDGAWVECGNCVFRDNGVGIESSGRLYNYSQSVYVGNLFEDNGVAWRFLTPYEADVFSFEGTRFSGNGTDIENPGGATLDTSGAIFE